MNECATAKFIRSADLWECPECARWNQERCDVGGDVVTCSDCEWVGRVMFLPDGTPL